jgi:hypothetical protein
MFYGYSVSWRWIGFSSVRRPPHILPGSLYSSFDSVLEKPVVCLSKIFSHFMEPERSFLFSQETATGRSLSQLNTVYIFTPFFKINFNIILHLLLGFANGLYLQIFSLKFYTNLSPRHAYYMSCLSHTPSIHHRNNIWWRVKIIKLLSCHLGPNIFLSNRGVKLTTHLHLVPKSKNEWSYTSTSPTRLNGVVLS